jgi:hypothetical protein
MKDFYETYLCQVHSDEYYSYHGEEDYYENFEQENVQEESRRTSRVYDVQKAWFNYPF